MMDRPRRAADLLDTPPYERPPSGREKSALGPMVVGLGVGGALLVAVLLFVRTTVAGAAARLQKPAAAAPAVAVADDSEEAYCTPAFKRVLERGLNACGLVGGEGRRGCQPADVKTFASISDADFNALFPPL